MALSMLSVCGLDRSPPRWAGYLLFNGAFNYERAPRPPAEVTRARQGALSPFTPTTPFTSDPLCLAKHIMRHHYGNNEGF